MIVYRVTAGNTVHTQAMGGTSSELDRESVTAPPDKWGVWSWEKLNDLLRASQLVSGRTASWILVFSFWIQCFSLMCLELLYKHPFGDQSDLEVKASALYYNFHNSNKLNMVVYVHRYI